MGVRNDQEFFLCLIRSAGRNCRISQPWPWKLPPGLSPISRNLYDCRTTTAWSRALGFITARPGDRSNKQNKVLSAIALIVGLNNTLSCVR